jgi:type IV secretion system protein VirD4
MFMSGLPLQEQDYLDNFLNDVPRGVVARPLKNQEPPNAKWLDPHEIYNHPLLGYDPADPQGKILLGALGQKLIGFRDNRHVMTIAGNRSGKSVGLINNLFFYDGSALVFDPKGELAKRTAKARLSLGQKLCIVDPFGVIKDEDLQAYRTSFNPMTRLSLDNPTIIEDAAQIADGLVIEARESRDPHWDEEARGLIAGMILYVAVSERFPQKNKNLVTVRKQLDRILETVPTEDGGRAFKMRGEIRTDLDALEIKGLGEISDAIRGDLLGFFEKSGTEGSGVLSSARRHTRLLTYKAIRGVTQRGDFVLEDLKRLEGGMTVYIVLPATRMSTCNRLMRVILNQFLDAMERIDIRPASPVLVALDEFPVLGFMQQLQDAAGQIASFDVKLWCILQDWSQGETLYGKRFESFAANSGVMTFFANNDLATTEYVSRLLDKTVLEARRYGEVSQDQRAAGVLGQNEDLELHDLLRPGEVARMFARNDPHKRQLIKIAGQDPMMISRVEYWDEGGPLQFSDQN